MLQAGPRQARLTGREDGKFTHHPSRLPQANVDPTADSAEHGVIKVPGPFHRVYFSVNL
jgi:hypothetical protein